MTIDFNKPVQTTSDYPVEIKFTDGRGNYPVGGYISKGEVIMYWNKEGKSNLNDRQFDLINVPEKKVLYLNVYPSYSRFKALGRAWTSRQIADHENDSSTGRIACIRIEYTEGQFDD